MCKALKRKPKDLKGARRKKNTRYINSRKLTLICNTTI